MILRFTNVKTGLVQSVREGSRLHRLVEANPAGYVPVVESKPKPKRAPKKEATDVPGNRGRRRGGAGPNPDDGGSGEG